MQPNVTFREALRFWVKLGFINFGGPAGQIALLHRELVERRQWISEGRFLHALNYCMLLPGPEAQQLAIYIGWLLHRTAGGIVAGTFFVIPSIFILLGLSYVHAAYGHVAAMGGVLAGFKPVVVAIIIEAVLRIGRQALKRGVHVLIAAAAFVGLFFLHIAFPWIVLSAAITGLIGARFWPASFSQQPSPPVPGPSSRGEAHGLATVIDDAAPLPPHTLPSRKRALRALAVGLALWALPFAGLILLRGWSSLHVREYRFFSQAALVTFGGAYAVLAYVTQAATQSFGWISQAQAVDGLALAETTPGPLIMVLQFVGFLAAWNHPEGLSHGASAVVGALVTTYVTFLPSFLFIFLGAPYVEVLRGNKRLNDALGGVTAAVVGVIFNLALVFGAAVIWPAGLSGGANWFALALGVAALLALVRLEAGVAWVVAAGGLIGLARALIL